MFDTIARKLMGVTDPQETAEAAVRLGPVEPVVAVDTAAGIDTTGVFVWGSDADGATLTTAPPPAPVMPPKPEPIEWNPEPLPDLAEYAELADSLGFAPEDIIKHKQEIKRRELIEFCLDKGFPMYGNDQVKTYMDALVAEVNRKRELDLPPTRSNAISWTWLSGNARVYWRWVPLVAKTRKHIMRDSQTGQTSVHDERVPGYDKPVPMFALKRAAAIKEKFPGEVEFVVTDYAETRPDPFLAVSRDGGELLIIAVWDEPGFGITNTK